MKKCEIKTKCPDLNGRVRRKTQVFVKISARVFIAMPSAFTFGDNSYEFCIFRFFMNLVDHDLTECQTLTLS